MVALNDNELKNITGGGIGFGAGLLISAGIVFVVGIIDGYIRPLACR